MDLLTKVFLLRKRLLPLLLKASEILLALAVLIAVFASALGLLPDFIIADWGNQETFIELLKVILFLAIGVELARLLISYSLETLVELIAFVIARKMLLIEGDFVEVLLGTLSLALIFGARYYFLSKDETRRKLTTS